MQVSPFSRLLRTTRLAIFTAALSLAPACRHPARGPQQANRLLINEALRQSERVRPVSAATCVVVESPPVEAVTPSSAPPKKLPPAPPIQ